MGREISRQETLDLVVQFVNQHFEEILSIDSSAPMLSPEKAEKIIKRAEKFKDTYYNEKELFSNSEDDGIYSH